MAFSKAIRDLLHGPPPGGTPFGAVYPFRESPIPPLVDGRTTALRILKRYFQEITFYRHGGFDANSKAELPPIGFAIPERDIHVEWPDRPDEVHLPALAFLSTGAADYESIGMTSNVEEGTVNRYAPDTVLIWLYEYVETFSIEIWAETKAQRRSILVGLERVLSPLEYMSGIRFRMPDYFDQLVCFSLQNRELVDDDFATKNRRRARLAVEMRFNVCALYPVNPLESSMEVEVVDGESDEGSEEEEEPSG